MSTILIVEDHAMSRQVLKSLFGYVGHRVLEAADGVAGLALARSEHPDLIISDIMMPTMDGLEFVRLLRTEAGLEETPVIFYTALYRVPDADQLCEIGGMCRVIPKPSEPAYILQAVNEMLGISAPEVGPAATAGLLPELSESGIARSGELRLAAMMDLSFHMVGQRDRVRLMDSFSRAAKEILRCKRVVVSVFEQGRTRYFLGSGEKEPVYTCPDESIPAAEILERVTVARSTFRRNGMAGVPSEMTPERLPSFECLLAVPFATSRRVYGWVCLLDKLDRSPFGDQDDEMAVALSAQAAIAYENILLVEEVRRAHEGLEQQVMERTEELSQANAKLKELDRLKSMFIAAMSHELRTPLNSVIGFSSILLNGWAGTVNSEQTENLAIILRSGKHLLNLIDDVIDVSKIEAGMIEPVIAEFDLHDLLAEAGNLISRESREKGIELKMETIPRKMYTDRRRLMQCVLNLMSNAVKFTEKGTISVRAASCGCSQEGDRAGSPPDDDKCIEIIVEDTGIGIKSDDMPRLFSAFVRLESRPNVPGTGLGLYLTRKLVTEVLKGEIVCASTYARGSKFILRIPERICKESW